MGNQISTNSNLPNSEDYIVSKVTDFNWIPSFYKNQFGETTESQNLEKLYIDHRDKIPEIENLDNKALQVVKIISSAINYSLLESNKLEPFKPSPEFLFYYLQRYMGLLQRHSFREVESVLHKFGIASKSDFSQYLISQDKKKMIPDEIINKARPYRHMKLIDVINKTNNIKKLLIEGKVVILGMGVYDNFIKTKNNPNLTSPDTKDEIIGGFCGLIVGFIEKDLKFIVLTARGKSWGENGYIFISYDLLENSNPQLCYLDISEDIIKMEVDMLKQQTNEKTDSNYAVIY